MISMVMMEQTASGPLLFFSCLGQQHQLIFTISHSISNVLCTAFQKDEVPKIRSMKELKGKDRTF